MRADNLRAWEGEEPDIPDSALIDDTGVHGTGAPARVPLRRPVAPPAEDEVAAIRSGLEADDRACDEQHALEEDPYVLEARRRDRRLGLALLAFAGAAAVLLVVVIVQWIVIAAQMREISALQRSRVMIGFATDDGVFVSSDRVPPAFVIRYARDFVSNLLNFDVETAARNFERARSMMTPELAMAATPALKKRLSQIRRLAIAQSFSVLTSEFREVPGRGWVVEFTGVLRKSVGVAQRAAERVVVTVHLARVAPTESHPEGMRVAKVDGPRNES